MTYAGHQAVGIQIANYRGMITSKTGRPRILVADDEEKIRYCIDVALKLKGYDVECVEDGSRAMRRIVETCGTDEAFDMLICDILMPKMSGDELLARVNSLEIELPVIAMTGYSSKDLVVKLMHNGCSDFIDKPFQLEEIEKRVDMLLFKTREKTERSREKNRYAGIGKNTRTAAHDLNNLLGTSMAYAEMALEKADRDEKIERYLEKIIKSSETAAEVCRSLLHNDCRSQLEQELVMTDLNAVVERAGAALKGIAPEDIQVVTGSEQKVIRANINALLIQRVLLNLGLNSIDAMPDGGRIDISLNEAVVKDHAGNGTLRAAEISVKDSGKGIAREDLQKIFREGYTTKKGGSGTGLYLIKNIVRQHKGWIEVSSSPGKGSLFEIYLPIY